MTMHALGAQAQGVRLVDYSIADAECVDISKPGPQDNIRPLIPSNANQTVIETLAKCRVVTKELAGGSTLVDTAEKNPDLVIFGISHMIHSVIRKDLLADRTMEIDDIFDRIIIEDMRQDVIHPSISRCSRQRVLNLMRKSGIIADKVPDRSCKPAGSTPSVKSICDILRENSDSKTRVSFEEICSASRSRHIVKMRFKAIWLTRTVCGHSLTALGGYFGDRDHTTILNSVNKIQLEMSTDRGLRASMELLCEKADSLGVAQSMELLSQARFWVKL